MRRKSFSFPTILLLIFGLGFGWVVGALLPAAFAQTAGPATACVGTNSNGSSLTLGGRALKPADIMRYSSSGACNTGEMAVTLGSSGLTRTLIVSPVGTASQNGAALIQALQSVITGSIPPSADSPYLLKIEPGVYDVGNTPILMPAYLTLEGSGEVATVISSSVGLNTGFPLSGGSLVMTSNTELRSLQINNNVTNIAAGSDRATVSVLQGATNVKIRNVTGNGLVGAGGSSNVAGLYNRGTVLVYDSSFTANGALNGYGLRNDAGVATAYNSSFQGLNGGGGRGRGIYNEAGTVTLLDGQLFATGAFAAFGAENTVSATLTIRNSYLVGGTGVRNTGGTVNIQGSIISSPSNAIYQQGGTIKIDGSKLSSGSASVLTTGGTVLVGSSHLDSPTTVSLNGGTVTCAYSYSQTYAQLSTGCV